MRKMMLRQRLESSTAAVTELPLQRPRADTSPSPDSMPRVNVLESAVRKELASINGQEELFLRATSELSNLLRDITHEHGRSYFRYVLREVFSDRTTLYEGRATHADVIAYAQSILKRMARAIHYAPLVLRASTQFVLREFQQHFPQCKSAEVIVVGSVLFLRILCPALVKPEVFGFHPHNAKSLPTAMQVAKLLQSTLRGTLVNANQPEAVASNDFIKSFHPFVETFLTRFPQLTSNVQQLRRPANLARFASWDALDMSRSNPEVASSWRGVDDTANRLRGMSVTTSEDLSQRKRKFSLKFW